MTYTIDEKKVLYADLDPKEGIVLNLDTKNYYRINETAQIVWQGIAARKDEETIAREIASAYTVSFEEALADVNSVVLEMKGEHLIEMPSEPPSFSMEEARRSKKRAR